MAKSLSHTFRQDQSQIQLAAISFFDTTLAAKEVGAPKTHTPFAVASVVFEFCDSAQRNFLAQGQILR